MKKVTIHSDGACSGNPGPGGWGAVLHCESPRAEKRISGGEARTTNNRMELLAVISALELLQEACRITVVTDSRYVCDAFRCGWLDNWQRNGWRTSDKKPVKNEDLWRRLLAAVARHEVSWEWIKGHAGHPLNELADALAVAARNAAG